MTTSGSTINNGAEIFRVNYVFFNPRIGLTWQPSQQQSAYLCLAQTKREPRMVNLYAAEESFYSGAGPLFASDTVGGRQRFNFSSPLIKPESMLDLELGWKYAAEHLKVAATLYWMDFHDELVSNGARDIFGNPIVGNAPHTNHLGLELEAAYTLWSENNNELRLLGNTTISRNRILDYHYALGSNSVDLSNNPISGFPDMILNLHAVLQIRDLSMDVGIRSIGQMYSDNFGAMLSDIRAQNPGSIDYADNVVDKSVSINASLSYRFQKLLTMRHVRVHMQVNNLGNSLYAAGANGKEFFPAAERNWFFGVEIEP
jgi:iron complex outermembrane receptor protein